MSDEQLGPDITAPHVILAHAVRDAHQEVKTAMAAYAPMNSSHEGWAVIKEELDELWDHVRDKPKDRQISSMRKEAIQIAAMALRFAVDVCNETVARR